MSIAFDSDFWRGAQPCIDSRRVSIANETVFFAIKGANTDGHAFIDDLYALGVRRFVVQHIPEGNYPQARWCVSEQPVKTLQRWASWHRSQCPAKVIGITGSNGKTIVKEWLAQLLGERFRVVKSPKSYNSQIGVPLSVLEMSKEDEIAIFEAGISKPDEMQHLQAIIQPHIGIFTNLGNAHDEGFDSQMEKLEEKFKLFEQAQVLVFAHHHSTVRQYIEKSPEWSSKQLLSWGEDPDAVIRVQKINNEYGNSINIAFAGVQYRLQLSFNHSNQASFENLMHCVAVLLHLGYEQTALQQAIERVRPVAMRLERKEGKNQCLLIDDSYNNDEAGLRIALDFWRQTAKENPEMGRTLILSDFLQTAVQPETFYPRIARLLQEYGVQRLIAVGSHFSRFAHYFQGIATRHFFETTAALTDALLRQQLHFRSEVILIKGARYFELEQVVQRLKKRVHATRLEVHLNALAHNFQFYRRLLRPKTRIMAMVKAFAYGSGGYEVAQLLQRQKVDYLGVAYTDEGVALRQRGINVPIMVMNTSEHELDTLAHYQLEPVVYSFRILEAIVAHTRKKNNTLSIHIEWDTGMHRLGFLPQEAEKLLPILQQNRQLHIAGTFSHLAASEEALHNDYTLQQITLFRQLADGLEQTLGIVSLKHILNSGGIARFPEAQMDMVRLGIGLYGIDPAMQHQSTLQPVATLKTIISQIRQLDPRETVGYSRRGVLQRSSRIATLAIGYADGLRRQLGNGIGAFWGDGHLLPIVGSVCMDMCFVDVTDTHLQEGDEVEWFGKHLPIELVAQAMHTIPYEVLTGVSARVPRVFYED